MKNVSATTGTENSFLKGLHRRNVTEYKRKDYPKVVLAFLGDPGQKMTDTIESSFGLVGRKFESRPTHQLHKGITAMWSFFGLG